MSPRLTKCAFTALLLALSFLAKAAEPITADSALDKASPTAGLCAIIGDCGPAEAIDLSKATGKTLFIQVPTPQQARALRESAESAGLLNRRIFITQAPPDRIHLATNLADQVISRANTPEPELLRVLRPGGQAQIADKKLTKPLPSGTDAWTHPYHGPDNNPLSKDQLARAPYLTHFLAEPLFSSQPEVTVMAGGRIFKAFGHMTFRAYQNASINKLFAMSAYNGALLWQKDLKPGFMIHRNTFVATPDYLYMADEQSCKIFDAATGEIVDQIVAPQDNADGPVWKWMAIQDGVLYALIGAPEVQAPVAKGTAQPIGGWPWGMWPGYDYADPKSAWGFGRTFVAIDLKTKKPLWQKKEQDYIDARALTMRSGRLYFYSPEKTLGCLDAKTGKDVWVNSDTDLLSAIGPNQKAQLYITGFSTSTYMKTSDKVILFAGPQRKNLVAASTEDGRLLWQRPGGNFQLVLRDDGVYALGDQQANKSFIFDYLTGRVLAEFRGRRACTRATGSIDSVFCRATEGTTRWIIGSNATQHLSPMRPACHDGVIVSDGLLYWGPWICGCHLTLVGAIALTPANDFDFTAKADESQQLIQAKSDTQPFPTDPNDWPTYLANNQRSRQSSTRVPDSVTLKWESKPSSPNIPTAPIVAGGLAFLAGEDGIVRALDASTGQLRWKAYTAGSIFFPPSLADGRLFVGSNDGHVYAFNASTGQPLWTFRCAPTNRMIPVYGELMSTWPVAGGVVVEGSTVYAAAGISHFDGTHVYALDAATGKIKWHNNSSGSLDPNVQNGITLAGALRLKDDRLTFPGGNVYATASYDTRTGQCSNQPAGPRTTTRIFLHPRKLWEPIYNDELPTPAGQIRLTPARGNQPQAIALMTPDNKPTWSLRVTAYNGAIVAGNALLVLARLHDTEDNAPAPFRLTALRLRDGSQLWSHKLPAPPVPHGTALDHAGRILVSLESGQTLCFSPN